MRRVIEIHLYDPYSAAFIHTKINTYLALIISILKETGGTTISVNKEQIAAAQTDLGACGISASPEGAATLAGLRHLREMRLLSNSESVVLIHTAHADKYTEPSEINPLPVIHSYSELKRILAAKSVNS